MIKKILLYIQINTMFAVKEQLFLNAVKVKQTKIKNDGIFAKEFMIQSINNKKIQFIQPSASIAVMIKKSGEETTDIFLVNKLSNDNKKIKDKNTELYCVLRLDKNHQQACEEIKKNMRLDVLTKHISYLENLMHRLNILENKFLTLIEKVNEHISMIKKEDSINIEVVILHSDIVGLLGLIDLNIDILHFLQDNENIFKRTFYFAKVIMNPYHLDSLRKIRPNIYKKNIEEETFNAIRRYCNYMTIYLNTPSSIFAHIISYKDTFIENIKKCQEYRSCALNTFYLINNKYKKLYSILSEYNIEEKEPNASVLENLDITTDTFDEIILINPNWAENIFDNSNESPCWCGGRCWCGRCWCSAIEQNIVKKTDINN